ncbi:MAG: biopolymer transporter ExbD [[Candidatus Thermochlorobacteriaceae] bacterium GBChlB]|nr:MAG: biopolymer transporter ExbD [[Candidatus Thermochlorobacteriaceae] bacterium GBChlB]
MGGGVGAPEQSSSRAKKGKKRKTKRMGFSLDMTPMVDVAFLLLTFFMLTTTFSKPNTMEINLPSQEMKDVEVAASNIFTLRMTEGNKAYWNIGFEPPIPFELYETGGDKPTISKKFKELIMGEKEKVRARVNDDVMVVVLKFDKTAKYRNMVDIIDELNLMKVNRFSLAPFTDADREEIQKLGAATPAPVANPQ